MKIIQVAVAIDNEGNENLYALDDEGSLYARMYVSAKVPTQENPYAYKFAYYWEPVVLPIGKPEGF